MDPQRVILINEFKSMESLRDQSQGMLSFTVDDSLTDYTIYLRGIETLVGANEGSCTRQSNHELKMKLSPQYPKIPPKVEIKDKEHTIFHPNWGSHGVLCYGRKYDSNASLSDFVIDIVKLMQYEIVNEEDHANENATKFYLRNKSYINNTIRKVRFPPPVEDDGIEFGDLNDIDDGIEIDISGLDDIDDGIEIDISGLDRHR